MTVLGRAHAVARIFRDAKPFLVLAARWAAKRVGTINKKELWIEKRYKFITMDEQIRIYISPSRYFRRSQA